MSEKDSKRRLLFLITSSDGGGAQKHLYEHAKLLDKERYEIEITCAPGGPLIGQVNKLGIKTFPLPTLSNAIKPIGDFEAFLSIYKLIKERGYDIVHCHSTKAGILGRLAARLAGVPAIIFTAHGFAFREAMGAPKKLLLVLLEKVASAACHQIITVSESDRRDALRLRLKNPSKVVTIHNGIDLDSVSYPISGVEEERKRWVLDETCIVVGTVANFFHNKGYHHLLQAARLVVDRNPEVKFLAVGGGPLREDMMKMAKLIRLNDNFIFTGYQYQVVPFLAMMDVFVLSSVKEGFPFSILEAMALGIPVVATNVGGIPEVVDDHKTGILVKPGDPESLANVILTLIEDRALREELGKNGGERVKDFSIHSMVKKVDDVYDTLLRGRN